MEHMGFAALLECKILKMDDKEQLSRVLFVCLGNICRSPAAEAILKHLISLQSCQCVTVDSCGLGNWHLGHDRDLRMKEAALARGIILNGVAKQFQLDYFDQFDYIFASDDEVLNHLNKYAKTKEQKEKIFLMTAFSSAYKGENIPDPYYQSSGGFECVLDMLEDSCKELLAYIIMHRKLT